MGGSDRGRADVEGRASVLLEIPHGAIISLVFRLKGFFCDNGSGCSGPVAAPRALTASLFRATPPPRQKRLLWPLRLPARRLLRPRSPYRVRPAAFAAAGCGLRSSRKVRGRPVPLPPRHGRAPAVRGAFLPAAPPCAGWLWLRGFPQRPAAGPCGWARFPLASRCVARVVPLCAVPEAAGDSRSCRRRNCARARPEPATGDLRPVPPAAGHG